MEKTEFNFYIDDLWAFYNRAAPNRQPCSAYFYRLNNTIIDLQKLEETLSQELQLRIRFAKFTLYTSYILQFEPQERTVRLAAKRGMHLHRSAQ